MRSFLVVSVIGLSGFVVAAVTPALARSRPTRSSTVEPAAGPRMSAPALPLVFEANRGQAQGEWDFLVRCRGYHAFVRPTGVVFSLDDAALAMSIEGALGREPDTAGLALPGRSNYFLGNDPERWITDVPQFRGARYPETTRGASWRVGGEGRRLEFAFDLAPGATAPRLRFDGQSALTVAADGALAFEMPQGRATISAPIAWQDEAGGARTVVDAQWTLDPDGAARIALGARDARRGVHVDPTLTYQTYLGGSDDEAPCGAAMDGAGAAYVGGSTNSANFPSTASAYDASQNGGSGNRYDMFVSKFAAAGTSLVYSTFIGAPGDDQAQGFAVDASGSAYIAGFTFNSTFPVTSGAYQTTKISSGNNGCLTKLAASGSALAYSTFVNSNTQFYQVAVDSTGAAISVDAGNLVWKFAPTGASVAWTRQFQSVSSGTSINGLCVSSTDDVFVCGSTTSNISTSGAYRTSLAGGGDAFLTKLNGASGAISFTTLLGGSSNDSAWGVGVNLAQQPYVAGRAASSNFPVTSDAYQAPSGTTQHAFLTRFNAAGSALRYSTVFRGAGVDGAVGVVVHPSGACVISGTTQSASSFPLLNAWQSTYAGNTDAFAAKFERDGTLAWSSYVGGASIEDPRALGLAPNGSVVLAGFTTSTDLATVSPYQSALVAGGDCFVTTVPDDLPTSLSAAAITTSTLPDWTKDVAYSQQLAAVNGFPPFAWNLVTGSSLPPGLSLSAGGLISGTPTTAGSYAFTVHLIDSADLVCVADRQITMLVNPTPTISTSALPPWTERLSFSRQLSLAGGTGALTVLLDSGSPPDGTTLYTDGRVAGTPTAAGDFTFVARVTDSVGASSTQTVTAHVNAFPNIADATLGPCTESRPFSRIFQATGGTGGLTWSLASGALPVNQPIEAATGRVFGTTLVHGDYAFTLRATDALGVAVDHAFAMTINPSPQILSGEILPLAVAGRPYSATLAGSGGTAPVVFALDTGLGSPPFPTGLGLSAGRISGTPTRADRKSPIVTYTDACGASASRQFFIDVAGRLDLTKKKVVETAAFAAGSGRVLRFLEVLADTTLSVTVAPTNKKAPLDVDLSVFDAQGAALDLSPWLKQTPKSISLKNAEIPTTGRWFVAVAPRAGFEGGVKLTVTIAAPTTWPGGGALVAAAPTVFEFSAPPGATAVISAKSAKGSAVLPHVVSVLADDDSDVAAGLVAKEKGKSATLALTTPLAGGRYRVLFAPRDANEGPATWTVKLKLPKTYDFALPDLAAGD